MPIISIEQLSHRYNGSPVLQGLNCSFAAGKVVAIIGRSGCGKSTLLRLIAGLQRPTEGQIKVNRARIGFIFQDSSLLPWRTVEQNIVLPLEIRSQSLSIARLESLLQLVGLSNYKNHYPWQLSGGMRQRVALAQALADDPDVLLLDEPFGALDELTRSSMQDLLITIQRQTKKTIILVTHSISEAAYVADRIMVLSGQPSGIGLDLLLKQVKHADQKRKLTASFTRTVKRIMDCLEAVR